MKYIILLILVFTISVYSTAQTDSAYIKSYPQEFTIRPYFYKKITSLSFEVEGKNEITYYPNTPVGLGVGFTYKGYALNLAYAPPVFRDKEKGSTKYIDLQYHYYGRKYIFDLYFQDYKGFYDIESRKQEIYHLYPDIHVIQYGATAEYIFNHKKFSYRAAMYCDEKQVRSAGSFQLGGGFYHNRVKSDTTQLLVGKDRFQNYQFSLIGGYAYSFIFKRDYFFTIGASIGGNLGIENVKGESRKVQITPNICPRVALGYNGDKWALMLYTVLNQVYVSRSNDINMILGTGRMQVTYIQRFGNSPGILKKIKPLNR